MCILFYLTPIICSYHTTEVVKCYFMAHKNCFSAQNILRVCLWQVKEARKLFEAFHQVPKILDLCLDQRFAWRKHWSAKIINIHLVIFFGQSVKISQANLVCNISGHWFLSWKKTCLYVVVMYYDQILSWKCVYSIQCPFVNWLKIPIF